MKHLFFGDVHGRDFWKILLEDQSDGTLFIDQFDKIVFAGDFVDSRDTNLSIKHMASNLSQIIDLKKQYPDKIVLLLGNHDLAYWWPESSIHQCYPHDYDARPIYKKIFWENKDLFDIAYQKDNFICTHAGISQLWYDINFEKLCDTNLTLADNINNGWKKYRDDDDKKYTCLFHISALRGGYDRSSGPLWLDSNEYDEIMLGYHQIAAHNRVSKINPKGVIVNDDTSLTCIKIREDLRLQRKEYCYTIDI